MNNPQLPIIPPPINRQAWIIRFQSAMAEIDRQLAELPGIIQQCQAETKD